MSWYLLNFECKTFLSTSPQFSLISRYTLAETRKWKLGRKEREWWVSASYVFVYNSHATDQSSTFSHFTSIHGHAVSLQACDILDAILEGYPKPKKTLYVSLARVYYWNLYQYVSQSWHNSGGSVGLNNKFSQDKSGIVCRQLIFAPNSHVPTQLLIIVNHINQT